MNETKLEARIQASAVAPRVTLEGIDTKIIAETYTTLPSGKVMVCELTLENGFTVRGEASTVSKENFNVEIGKTISYRNAKEKIWQLEGYLLQEKLYKELN